jgi:hypothetical protein
MYPRTETKESCRLHAEFCWYLVQSYKDCLSYNSHEKLRADRLLLSGLETVDINAGSNDSEALDLL